MSDREEVRQACETLFEAYCNQAVSCGAGSQAECLASIEDAGGCSPMIGYKEGYEACLSIWQGPACLWRPETAGVQGRPDRHGVTRLSWVRGELWERRLSSRGTGVA